MERRTCPTCRRLGLQSRIPFERHFAYSADFKREQYWDEKGDYHDVQHGVVTTHYVCTNGHDVSSSQGPYDHILTKPHTVYL